MMSKVALVLVALVSVGQAISCTKYTCASGLATNVCASMESSSAVSVNEDGCDSSHMCSISGVQAWAATAANGSTYSCPTIPTSTESTETWTKMFCTMVANKTFKSGATTPISCTSDTECQLNDGTYAVCTCALTNTGKGICKPHVFNNSIFPDLWNDCSDGLIEDQDAYNYYIAYEDAWIYQNSGLSCVGIFSESQALDDYYSAYSGSIALAMGVVAALLT